jgi:hypothetical protein
LENRGKSCWEYGNVAYLDGSALNIRPCPAELRDALRTLAQAEGLPLYTYLLGVLEQHVAGTSPRDRTLAEVTSD